jgi:hypothetical protein
MIDDVEVKLRTLETQKPRQGQLKTVSMAISPRFGNLRLGTHSMISRLSPHNLLRWQLRYFRNTTHL